MKFIYLSAFVLFRVIWLGFGTVDFSLVHTCKVNISSSNTSGTNIRAQRRSTISDRIHTFFLLEPVNFGRVSLFLTI